MYDDEDDNDADDDGGGGGVVMMTVTMMAMMMMMMMMMTTMMVIMMTMIAFIAPGFLSASQSSSLTQYQITPGFFIPSQIHSAGKRLSPSHRMLPEGLEVAL